MAVDLSRLQNTIGKVWMVDSIRPQLRFQGQTRIGRQSRALRCGHAACVIDLQSRFIGLYLHDYLVAIGQRCMVIQSVKTLVVDAVIHINILLQIREKRSAANDVTSGNGCSIQRGQAITIQP